MKYTAIDKKEFLDNVNPLYYRPGKNQSVIEEFINSKDDVWLLEPNTGEYKNAINMSSSLKHTIKKSEYKNVQCISRSGRVYLFKVPAQSKKSQKD